MSAERWHRVDALFVEALEQPAAGRDRFIAERCGDDDALRTELLSLLAAAGAAGDFLADTAFERLATVVRTEGWTLGVGARVGAYRVQSHLGSGSGGEVWRARDDRLGRDVALKVLLPHLVDDPERVRRFADEARAIGSLNHPNIVAVYDVGQHDGLPYIVSECLAGQSLRGHLDAGPMMIADVVRVGTSIARGLAAAHARAIVHRDLKPENVFLASDGTVKILDFGIAKLQRTAEDLARAGTFAGLVLGTAGYMAPEQVRGQDVDARADLFALGVMLHEMLTGVAPFKRSTQVDTLTAVLTDAPPDLTQTAVSVPDDLATIVRHLLEKDRDARFYAAADVVWALEQAGRTAPRVGTGATSAATSGGVQHSSWRHRSVWLAIGMLGLVSAMAWWMAQSPVGRPREDAPLARFSWPLPPGVQLASTPAVAPDGRSVAFTGIRAGRSHLFVRGLDAAEATEIDRTEGAHLPFWSPDSQWIGFFAQRRVMKVSLAGGAPITITDDSHAGTFRYERGGTWGRHDLIVYGGGFSPPSLFSVPAAGGTATPVMRLALERGENQRRFPAFLPDERHVLFQGRGIGATRGLFVGSIVDDMVRRLIEIDSQGVYVPDTQGSEGVLLYSADGRLTAQRFDASRLTLVGAARPLGVDVGRETLYQPAPFSASSDLLAYAGQLPYGGEIKTVMGDTPPALLFDRQEQLWPRLSRDGTRLAFLLINIVEGNADIWVYDVIRHTRTRVTTAPERDLYHVWSPDGRELAYRPDVEDRRRLTIVAADGSGHSRDLVCPRDTCEPTDWSPDGRSLIVNASASDNTDVWAIAAAEGGVTRPLVQTSFNERDARLSPDGRWIAYVSDETGTPEVSIRGLDGASRRYVVSSGGGDQVVWARDGRSLYYVDVKGQLQRTWIQDVEGGLRLGGTVALAIAVGSGHASTQYDVANDGRIYYLDPTPMRAPTEIHVVLGWQHLLR